MTPELTHSNHEDPVILLTRIEPPVPAEAIRFVSWLGRQQSLKVFAIAGLSMAF